MQEFISSLSILFQKLICLSLCQNHCLEYCSFVLSLEIRKGESSNSAFFFQDCFSYSGSLKFLYEFQDQFVDFCKNSSEILIETALAPHSSTLAWKIPWTEEPGGLHGVAKSRTRLSDFTFTFHFHALEKEMATHSSVLAWRIPGTGEPGGLPCMGSHRVRHD